MKNRTLIVTLLFLVIVSVSVGKEFYSDIEVKGDLKGEAAFLLKKKDTEETLDTDFVEIRVNANDKLVYKTDTSTTITVLSTTVAGTSGSVLVSTGTDVEWGQVSALAVQTSTDQFTRHLDSKPLTVQAALAILDDLDLTLQDILDSDPSATLSGSLTEFAIDLTDDASFNIKYRGEVVLGVQEDNLQIGTPGADFNIGGDVFSSDLVFGSASQGGVIRGDAPDFYLDVAGSLETTASKLTKEGGYAVWMTNDHTSVLFKGTVVEATDYMSVNVSSAQSSSSVGVVYENIASGEGGWIITHGVVDARLCDDITASAGDLVRTSFDTTGRVVTRSSPSFSWYYKVGKCVQDADLGTNQYIRVIWGQ